MPIKKGQFLSFLRFALFVEAGIAAILYVLYMAKRYFSPCDVDPGANILCPAPSFAELPHPAFFTMVDLLILTASAYVLYAAYLYFSIQKKKKKNSNQVDDAEAEE